MHQRLLRAQLDENEGGERDDGDGEQPEDRGGSPAPARALLESEDGGEQPDGEQPDAGDVEAHALLAGSQPPQHRPGEEQGEDRHGHVAPPDPLPADGVGEHAADQRPDREGDAADGSPDAEDEPLLLLREGVVEDRHGGGHQNRCAHALEHAPTDELEHGARGRHHDRGERVEHHADDEDAFAAQDVAELSSEHDERSHGEEVGVQRPRQRGRRERQLVGDGADRGVDGGRVHRNQEQGDARGDERAPRMGRRHERRRRLELLVVTGVLVDAGVCPDCLLHPDGRNLARST